MVFAWGWHALELRGGGWGGIERGDRGFTRPKSCPHSGNTHFCLKSFLREAVATHMGARAHLGKLLWVNAMKPEETDVSAPPVVGYPGKLYRKIKANAFVHTVPRLIGNHCKTGGKRIVSQIDVCATFCKTL